MGGKSRPPPPPDYTPVAQASKEAAEISAAVAREQLELSREQYNWAKEQYAKDSALTEGAVKSFIDMLDLNAEAARRDRERYEQQFQPLEDELIREARDYASPERRDLEMGRAVSAVAQQFDAARENAMRNLESYGINPASTRFAALDIGLRTQQAAAQAAAANQASQMVDATGRALRSEALNIGRGYPGQIAGTYNTALAAGSGGVNSQLAQTASGANTMGTGLGWAGAANASAGTGVNALNTWGNTLNMGYRNALDAWKANQSASSGIGSALGLIGGLVTSPIPGSSMLGRMFAAEGGSVPPHASPSMGRAIDDVPAQLTAGEFVIPKDVVDWYGQQYFYKLIEKAQNDKGEAKQRTGAIPDVRNAPQQAPTFTSHSGALPV